MDMVASYGRWQSTRIDRSSPAALQLATCCGCGLLGVVALLDPLFDVVIILLIVVLHDVPQLRY